MEETRYLTYWKRGEVERGENLYAGEEEERPIPPQSD